MDSLQLTLVIGLIVMAIINAVSLVWAFLLDRKLKARPSPKVYEVHVDGSKVFKDMDMSEVEKVAHQQLQQIASEAAQRLKQSLENSLDEVSVHVSDMANTTLSQEFEQYQVSLQALRDQSIQEFSKLQQELDQRRVQLTEHLDKVIREEGEKRLATFDARLNDVISSYLVESLGTQVDLGAQSAYIFETLQAHKDEIKRDILA